MMRLLRVAALVVLWTAALPALAGPEPSPTDAFPKLVRIEARGKAISLYPGYQLADDTWGIGFNDGYQIVDGDWASWSGPLIDNRTYREREYPPSRLTCSVPNELREKYRNDSNEVNLLLCDADRVWFASSGYCSEGADQQGRLYSYDPRTGRATQYPGFIPRCEAFAGLARIGGQLWAASIRPGEFGTAPGSGVLVFDIVSRKRLRVMPAGTFTSPEFLSIAHQPQPDYLWVTTNAGVDRYTPATGKWERRYFDIALTPANRLRLVLSGKKPSVERWWMAHHLISYPLDDPRSFARTWESVVGPQQAENLVPPLRHRALLPHYVSALLNMGSDWNDYAFVFLLRHIGGYTEDADRVRALLTELDRRPLSSLRRGAVVELHREFGLPGAETGMDRHFEMLKERFFMRGLDLDQLCGFAFKHPEYLARLNEHYVRHAVSGEINVRFLDDCVRPHSLWPGAEAFIPTVLKGLEGEDPRALAALCSMFNRYAKPYLELPEALIRVLKARKALEPHDRARTDGWYRTCIPASYWLANSRAGIDTLLAEIERYPELVPLAIDVLQEVTERHFASPPEWRAWWRAARDEFLPRRKTYYWKLQ